MWVINNSRLPSSVTQLPADWLSSNLDPLWLHSLYETGIVLHFSRRVGYGIWEAVISRFQDIGVSFVVRTSAVIWCCRFGSRLSLWHGAISVFINWRCTVSQHSVKCGGWYTRPGRVVNAECYHPWRAMSCYVSIYVFFAWYLLVQLIRKMAVAEGGQSVSQCAHISSMSVTH